MGGAGARLERGPRPGRSRARGRRREEAAEIARRLRLHDQRLQAQGAGGGDGADRAPCRRMSAPGGFEMSVAMTNCGMAGWVTDRRGYRYDRRDPASGLPWPPMPAVFHDLAAAAAAEAGFPGFWPDACLVNRYEPGARLSLHQDKDEATLEQPVVSVSLGLPATFQFGGQQR